MELISEHKRKVKHQLTLRHCKWPAIYNYVPPDYTSMPRGHRNEISLSNLFHFPHIDFKGSNCTFITFTIKFILIFRWWIFKLIFIEKFLFVNLLHFSSSLRPRCRLSTSRSKNYFSFSLVWLYFAAHMECRKMDLIVCVWRNEF